MEMEQKKNEMRNICRSFLVFLKPLYVLVVTGARDGEVEITNILQFV